MNPAQQAIFNKIVKPALSSIPYDVEATITKVDYYKQTAEVYFVDEHLQRRTLENLNLPADANGVYRQSLYPGDKVRVAFKNGNHRNPYITMTYKFSSQKDYFSKKGASIPKGIGYM